MEILGGFDFSLIEIILSGVLIIAFVYQLFYHFRIQNIAYQQKRKKEKSEISFNKEAVPVSVVICAKDDTDNLREFLPLFLTQEYSEFEVIVVNDGGNEDTEDLIREMKKSYPNLKSTFVPAGTTNLSTKKLALTLGIKAAKYDWILLSDADCYPQSSQWLATMSRNFVSGVEFVLGYSPYITQKSFLNRLITYDTLFIGMQYLGYSKHLSPYMGVGRNMAYRKDVFFRNKGFATNLHLRSGDDDLMVNYAAHKFNTRIETSPDSVIWSIPEKKYMHWYFQKERHLSVSTFYKSSSKMMLFVEPFLRGLFYLSFIGLAVFAILSQHWLLAALAGILFLTRWIVQLFITNRASKYYKGRKYFLTLLLFDIYLPLLNAWIMTFGRMGSKAKNISWK
jgi:glycosyltransferase involved in cell wall biosynthesis